MRIVVVGAGVVGVACARFLQRDGHRVTILDPREPGDGASFGNAGIIATNEVHPIAMPGLWKQIPRMLLDPYGPLVLRWRYLPRIAPWLWELLKATRRERVEGIAAALAALAAGANAAWAELLRGAGAGDLLRRSGWLHLYASEAAFARTGPQRELMRRHGVPFEPIGSDEIRQLEPGLAPIFARGVLFPDCGFVLDPKRLVTRLAAAFVGDGGTLRREAATGFQLDDGQRAVVGERGRHSADAIVLAAGAWSRPLAARLGAPVPLDTERGYHLMFDMPEPGLRRPTLWADHHINLVPMAHGLRLTSGVELAGLAAPPDYRRIDRLAGRARAMLPGLAQAPRSRWQGCRPSLPDSLPVLGRAPRHRGLFFAFGHQHLGVTLAAVSGRIVADLVAGRDPGLDLSPYRAERW